MSAERWYSSFAAPVWPVRSIPNRATASTTVNTIANALIRVIGSSASEGEPEPQLHNARLVGHVRVEGRLAVTRVAFRRRIRPVVDRKSTRLNSSHLVISYAVFCLKKKTNTCIVSSPLIFPKGYTHYT